MKLGGTSLFSLPLPLPSCIPFLFHFSPHLYRCLPFLIILCHCPSLLSLPFSFSSPLFLYPFPHSSRGVWERSNSPTGSGTPTQFRPFRFLKTRLVSRDLVIVRILSLICTISCPAPIIPGEKLTSRMGHTAGFPPWISHWAQHNLERSTYSVGRSFCRRRRRRNIDDCVRGIPDRIDTSSDTCDCRPAPACAGRSDGRRMVGYRRPLQATASTIRRPVGGPPVQLTDISK